MASVLLVEDHPLNRRLMRDLLALRFEVIEAGTAEDALATLRDCRPDLILMDIQLPGMDGVTCTRRIKAAPETADLPVVAVSAHALPHDIEAGLSAGCEDYITKPITEDPFCFLDRLDGYIARARARHGG